MKKLFSIAKYYIYLCLKTEYKESLFTQEEAQYLRSNIAEFANMSEIFWRKNSRYIGPQYKGVPNIAELANMSKIFGQKTFGNIGPPVITFTKNTITKRSAPFIAAPYNHDIIFCKPPVSFYKVQCNSLL